MTNTEVGRSFDPQDQQAILTHGSFMPFSYDMSGYEPFMPDIIRKWQDTCRTDLASLIDEHRRNANSSDYILSPVSKDLLPATAEYTESLIANADNTNIKNHIRKLELFRFGIYLADATHSDNDVDAALIKASGKMAGYYEDIAVDCYKQAQQMGFPDISVSKPAIAHFLLMEQLAREKMARWKELTEIGRIKTEPRQPKNLDVPEDYGSKMLQSVNSFISSNYPQHIDSELTTNEIVPALYGFFWGNLAIEGRAKHAVAILNGIVDIEVRFGRFQQQEVTPQEVIRKHLGIIRYLKEVNPIEIKKLLKLYGFDSTADNERHINTLIDQVKIFISDIFNYTTITDEPFLHESRNLAETKAEGYIRSRLVPDLTARRMTYEEARQIINMLMKGRGDIRSKKEFEDNEQFRSKLSEPITNRIEESYRYGCILGFLPLNKTSMQNIDLIIPLLESLTSFREGAAKPENMQATLLHYQEFFKLIYRNLDIRKQMGDPAGEIGGLLDNLAQSLRQYGIIISVTPQEDSQVGTIEQLKAEQVGAIDLTLGRIAMEKIGKASLMHQVSANTSYADNFLHGKSFQYYEEGLVGGPTIGTYLHDNTGIKHIAQRIVDVAATEGTINYRLISTLSRAASSGIGDAADANTSVEDIIARSEKYGRKDGQGKISDREQQNAYLQGAIVGLTFGHDFTRLQELERLFRIIVGVDSQADVHQMKRQFPDQFAEISNELYNFRDLMEFPVFALRATLGDLIDRGEFDEIELDKSKEDLTIVTSDLGESPAYQTYYSLIQLFDAYNLVFVPDTHGGPKGQIIKKTVATEPSPPTT